MNRMPIWSLGSTAAATAGHDRARAHAASDAVILAVADGAGGAGGDAASAAEYAVTTACSAGPDAGDPVFWPEFLRCLDAELSSRAGGGHTTLVAARVQRGVIVGGAVGDSIAWVLQRGAVHDLTHAAPRKPLLGSGAADPVAFGPIEIQAGSLLLATDGLWKYAARDRIAEAVRALAIPGPVEPLIDLARLRTGGLQDDVAVAVLRSIP